MKGISVEHNAYPVIDLELGKVSFNLYRDRNLSDYLDAEVELYGKIHDGSGLVDIPVKVFKESDETLREIKA